MGESWGILAAVLSSGLGGTSIGATRYLVSAIDPLAIGSFRFGIGFVFLLPVALWQGAPLARAPGLARRGRFGRALLCRVPAAVQRRADLHHGCAGCARSIDASAADN